MAQGKKGNQTIDYAKIDQMESFNKFVK